MAKPTKKGSNISEEVTPVEKEIEVDPTIEVGEEGIQNDLAEEVSNVPALKEMRMEKAPIKMQKIRTLMQVDCIIGGKPYKFAEDVVTEVPMDVAAILTFSRQAYRT